MVEYTTKTPLDLQSCYINSTAFIEMQLNAGHLKQLETVKCLKSLRTDKRDATIRDKP